MRKHALPLLVDVVLVGVFCAIGRASHEEAGSITGLLNTAWPFLTGLAVGWTTTVVLYRDKFAATLVVPTGVLVWFSTLLVGMILRVISGQGTAVSFVIVAGTVLAFFLVGWRGVYGFSARAAASPARAASSRPSSLRDRLRRRP